MLYWLKCKGKVMCIRKRNCKGRGKKSKKGGIKILRGERKKLWWVEKICLKTEKCISGKI